MKGNLLKITTIPADSEWCDKDRVLLHACFQLLVDFIEQEKPEEFVDYKSTLLLAKEWAELQELYNYWKYDHPKLVKAVDRALSRWHGENKIAAKQEGSDSSLSFEEASKRGKIAFEKYMSLDDQLQAQEDEMLRRLINVRDQLWC
jgi:hypothetical protein